MFRQKQRKKERRESTSEALVGLGQLFSTHSQGLLLPSLFVYVFELPPITNVSHLFLHNISIYFLNIVFQIYTATRRIIFNFNKYLHPSFWSFWRIFWYFFCPFSRPTTNYTPSLYVQSLYKNSLWKLKLFLFEWIRGWYI